MEQLVHDALESETAQQPEPTEQQLAARNVIAALLVRPHCVAEIDYAIERYQASLPHLNEYRI